MRALCLFFHAQAAWLLGFAFKRRGYWVLRSSGVVTGFAFKRRGYWVRVQAAWLLGSRQAAWLLGSRQAAWLLGLWNGSCRCAICLLPSPQTPPPGTHKNARVFVGCGQWGRGFIRRQAA